jgi:nitrite reductase (NADH) large subunit
VYLIIDIKLSQYIGLLVWISHNPLSGGYFIMTQNNSKAWRCTVCGYIHREVDPPNECPVCGSPKKFFEPYLEPAETTPETKTKNWRCLVCNHKHTGDNPPVKCPVCGAPDKRFESIGDVKETGTADGIAEEIVVVGGGIAGISAVESIRSASVNARITLLSKEKHLPYFRLNLTRLLADEVMEDNLPIHPETWYLENRIKLVKGAEVSSISLEQKEISLMDGAKYSFDKLILTAGSHPFIPPVVGINLEGVTTLRTIDDARYIRKSAEQADSVVVVGGGILGLEAAGALIKYAKKVTVFENFDYLMPRQLSLKAAKLLEKHITGIGINLKTGVSLKELAGDERVAGAVLKNGESVPADLVIFSTGVRSNSYLARTSGLQVNQGIIVNDYLQTSHANVYAAGDLAEHRGISYGLWGAAQYQGSIAGMNAAGQKAEFGGIPRSNTLKVLGVDLFSIGRFEAEDGSYTVIEDEKDASYTRFVFRDTHLVGAILYGDTLISAALKKAIEGRKDYSGLLKNQPSAKEVWDYIAIH